MTIIGVPGDSRDYPILNSLLLHNQGACVIKHGSVRPDGRPTYKGTQCDLIMHVSPLLVHMLLTRHLKEHVMSTEGTSVPYICMESQMAQAGNNALIVHDRRLAHN